MNSLLNSSLNGPARWVIGAFGLILGLPLILMSPGGPDYQMQLSIAALPLVVSLICFTSGRIRHFLGSCIALVIFGAGVWYLYHQIESGSPIYAGKRKPSLVNAIIFLILFGLPSLGFIWKLKFGLIKIQKKENYE